jgi:regulator of protease activity HflC (stomatin/prohibitin superfamily)
VVPLFGFAVVTLILASSLVFVDSNERAVIEHFGTKVAVVDPGLHLTWPWPIDVAYKVAVDQIHELKIGLEESSGDQKKDELILWTNKHSQEPHQMVLLATPQLTEIIQNIVRSATSRPAAVATTTQPSGDKEMSKAVPVSMLRVAAVIQYRIRDAYDWIRQYEKPEKMLESIANREITIRCAHADVLGLMGSDREQIEKEIGEAIQASADRVKLGIEIKFFGLQGVHPPSELGEDFQKVISAEHQKIAAINSARAEANKKLTEAAGDVDVTRARQLEQAITEMNRVANAAGVTDAERTQAQDRVRELFFGTPDHLIRPIGGKAAVRVAGAKAERWRLENEAAARAVLFEKQLDIKNAAPRVFRMREYLAVLDRSMNKARKYIIAVQGHYELPMFQINLMDPLSASLDVALDKDKP